MLMEWKEYISSHTKVTWMPGTKSVSMGDEFMISGAHTPPGALCAAGEGLAEQVTPVQIPHGKLPTALQPCPDLGFALLSAQSQAGPAALSHRDQIKCHSHLHRCAHVVQPVYFIKSYFSLKNNFLTRISLHEEPLFRNVAGVGAFIHIQVLHKWIYSMWISLSQGKRSVGMGCLSAQWFWEFCGIIHC